MLVLTSGPSASDRALEWAYKSHDMERSHLISHHSLQGHLNLRNVRLAAWQIPLCSVWCIWYAFDRENCRSIELLCACCSCSWDICQVSHEYLIFVAIFCSHLSIWSISVQIFVIFETFDTFLVNFVSFLENFMSFFVTFGQFCVIFLFLVNFVSLLVFLLVIFAPFVPNFKYLVSFSTLFG